MEFLDTVMRYNTLRKQKKTIEEEMSKLGKEIQAYAEVHGNKDSKGSYFIESGDFICGKTARTSIKLNTDRALEYVQQNALPCVKTVDMLDEEAFEQLVSNGTIDVDTLETLLDKKTTYAVAVTEKEKMPEVQEVTVTTTAKPKKLRLSRKGN